jgi:hypothetical protein
MTNQAEHPVDQRPVRRLRLWIVVAASVVVVVVVVAVLIGALMRTSENSSTQGPRGLLTQVIARTNDTARAAGGVWTFEDKSPWVPSDTSGYTGVPCGDADSGPQQYPVQLNSGGVAGRSSSARQVAKHWEGLGYSVRTVVAPQADNSDFTEIAADLPNGAKLVYSVSTKISGIDALSECSSDPKMLDTSK